MTHFSLNDVKQVSLRVFFDYLNRIIKVHLVAFEEHLTGLHDLHQQVDFNNLIFNFYLQVLLGKMGRLHSIC